MLSSSQMSPNSFKAFNTTTQQEQKFSHDEAKMRLEEEFKDILSVANALKLIGNKPSITLKVFSLNSRFHKSLLGIQKTLRHNTQVDDVEEERAR